MVQLNVAIGYTQPTSEMHSHALLYSGKVLWGEIVLGKSHLFFKFSIVGSSCLAVMGCSLVGREGFSAFCTLLAFLSDLELVPFVFTQLT